MSYTAFTEKLTTPPPKWMVFPEDMVRCAVQCFRCKCTDNLKSYYEAPWVEYLCPECAKHFGFTPTE